jgi:hypothetical protein
VIRLCHRLVLRLPCRLDKASLLALRVRGVIQNLDFSLFLAIAVGIASFLTAIYSTTYAFRFIAPIN